MSASTEPTGAERESGLRAHDDALIDLVRDTVTQLEALTQRLNSYLENGDWEGHGS